MPERARTLPHHGVQQDPHRLGHMSINPVLTTELPFALPDFANATPRDYHVAIEEGMRSQLGALAKLRQDGSPATVANVLAAWDRAEGPLRRALNVFFSAYASDATDEMIAIEQEIAPRLAEHRDRKSVV